MRIRLLPEAEHDLELGADFYESRDPGLGTYFTDCLTSDIDSLALFGGIHEKYRGFYRSLSKRFPFVIYYTIHGDCVEVYAILDARQAPESLDKRLDPPRTRP